MSRIAGTEILRLLRLFAPRSTLSQSNRRSS
jgi:hypothetical protein